MLCWNSVIINNEAVWWGGGMVTTQKSIIFSPEVFKTSTIEVISGMFCRTGSFLFLLRYGSCKQSFHRYLLFFSVFKWISQKQMCPVIENPKDCTISSDCKKHSSDSIQKYERLFEERFTTWFLISCYKNNDNNEVLEQAHTFKAVIRRLILCGKKKNMSFIWLISATLVLIRFLFTYIFSAPSASMCPSPHLTSPYMGFFPLLVTTFPWWLIALTCFSLPLISLNICACLQCTTNEIITAHAGDFRAETANIS